MKALHWRQIRVIAASCLLAGAMTAAKAEAEEDSEKGAWIDRADGGKLHLVIENRNFELHFYNGAGEAVKPDAAQAILHYTSRTVRSRETLALFPIEKDDKVILSSQRVIRPPYRYDILLVLNFDEEDRNTESHHLVFQQKGDSDDDG